MRPSWPTPMNSCTTRCIAWSSHNIGRLPVVSREDPRRMVGYFDRSNMFECVDAAD